MLHYYAVILFASFFAFLSMFLDKKSNRYFFVVLSISVVFFAGTRVGVKGDYFNYIDIFNAFDRFEDVFSYARHSKEPLYMAVNVFFNNFLNQELFFLCLAAISIFLTCESYYKYSRFFLASLLIYVSFFLVMRDMGAIRAGVAYSIFLFSIRYIDSDVKKYFLLNILACGFHITAVLSIAFLIFKKFDLSRKKLCLLLFISPLLQLSGVMGGVFSIISQLPFLGIIALKTNSYLSADYLTQDLGLFDLTNIKNFVISLLVLGFYDVIVKDNKYAKYIILSFVIGTVIRIAFSDFGVLVGRGYTIFNTVEPIIVSYLLLVVNFKGRILSILFFIFYSFLVFTLNVSKYELLPYDSYLFGVF